MILVLILCGNPHTVVCQKIRFQNPLALRSLVPTRHSNEMATSQAAVPRVENNWQIVQNAKASNPARRTLGPQSRGQTSIAAVAAKDARRFIRSSLQPEETGAGRRTLYVAPKPQLETPSAFLAITLPRNQADICEDTFTLASESQRVKGLSTLTWTKMELRIDAPIATQTKLAGCELSTSRGQIAATRPIAIG